MERTKHTYTLRITSDGLRVVPLLVEVIAQVLGLLSFRIVRHDERRNDKLTDKRDLRVRSEGEKQETLLEVVVITVVRGV